MKLNISFLVIFLFMFSTSSHAIPKIVISVDWEGRELSEPNLSAMEKFKNDFPEIPLLQFMNAAYFTKKRARSFRILNAMKRVIKENDEIGLHIHSWRSLVEASGVKYRHYPKWTPGRWDRTNEDCTNDCGHEVPLWAYESWEFDLIVKKSLEIFQTNGLPRPYSFRAGGWMASNKVIDVLVDNDFKMDSSAVPYHLLERRFKGSGYKIHDWVDEIWGRISTTSNAYEHRGLIELPDNGCLADYMTGDDMLEVFIENVNEWKKNPSKDQYISIGFHQETAARYISRIRKALLLIKDYARKRDIPYTFATGVE